ncbi:MAG: hypothetical protein ACRD5L_02410, partial [Bryobacteraceae bacterium]
MRRLTFLNALTALLILAPVPGTAQANGPYYQAPIVPGKPVGRTAEGKPDMQGFWTPRFNQAIFEVQDHPTAKRGIG